MTHAPNRSSSITSSSTRVATRARSVPRCRGTSPGLRAGRIVGDPHRRRTRDGAAHRVRPRDRRRARRVRRGRSGRRGRRLDVGGRAASRASTTSTKPFAFALVRPDGADVPMVHVVDVASADEMSVGHAGDAALGAPSGSGTSPTSRRGCRWPTASSRPRRTPSRRRRAGHRHHRADPARVRDQRRARAEQVPARHRRGQAHRPEGGRLRQGVPAAARLGPDAAARRPRSRSRSRQSGTVTTFCVTNIPGLSESAPEVPYVCRADPARRRQHAVPRSRSRASPSTRSAWACGCRRSGTRTCGPTPRCLKWFEPNGEPDAAYESYREYAMSESDERRRRRRVRAGDRRDRTVSATRSSSSSRWCRRRCARSRHRPPRHRVHDLRVVRLPERWAVHVRAGTRRRRRVAAGARRATSRWTRPGRCTRRGSRSRPARSTAR